MSYLSVGVTRVMTCWAQNVHGTRAAAQPRNIHLPANKIIANVQLKGCKCMLGLALAIGWQSASHRTVTVTLIAQIRMATEHKLGRCLRKAQCILRTTEPSRKNACDLQALEVV
eukprot:4785304-Amphidinium_carterae.1